MIENTKLDLIIAYAAKELREKGIKKDGYLMFPIPQMFRLLPEKNMFKLPHDNELWEKGTQKKQAADIALSLLGCNLQNRERMAPSGVNTITKPDYDYTVWRNNFKRCYNNLKSLKLSDSTKTNSCVFPFAHPITHPKPCIIYLQFGLYNNKLQMIVNARATHLFMLNENFSRHIHLQVLFSSLLNLEIGDVFFISNNFHILLNQKEELPFYINFKSKQKQVFLPPALTLSRYHSDRKNIRSEKYDRVEWEVFKNLIDQKNGN